MVSRKDLLIPESWTKQHNVIEPKLFFIPNTNSWCLAVSSCAENKELVQWDMLAGYAEPGCEHPSMSFGLGNVSYLILLGLGNVVSTALASPCFKAETNCNKISHIIVPFLWKN